MDRRARRAVSGRHMPRARTSDWWRPRRTPRRWMVGGRGAFSSARWFGSPARCCSSRLASTSRRTVQPRSPATKASWRLSSAFSSRYSCASSTSRATPTGRRQPAPWSGVTLALALLRAFVRQPRRARWVPCRLHQLLSAQRLGPAHRRKDIAAYLCWHRRMEPPFRPCRAWTAFYGFRFYRAGPARLPPKLDTRAARRRDHLRLLHRFIGLSRCSKMTTGPATCSPAISRRDDVRGRHRPLRCHRAALAAP